MGEIVNPFIYGEEVSGENFCNRKAEIKELSRDIENGQNVMLYSPRRFGKTSLIKEVLRKAKSKGIITVYVDLYSVLNEEDFIRFSLRAMTKEENASLDTIVSKIKKLLKRVSPKVSVELGEGGGTTFNFSLDSEDVVPALEDIFDGFYKSTKAKNKKAVIVFDEFQQIGYFDSDRVEKTLRSVIQSHRNISYIFLGSKKHLIFDLFNNPERPFYKSTKHFPLEKISVEDLSVFIKERFVGTKNIAEMIPKILEITELHPYYTQFLCNVLWEFNAEKKSLTAEDIEQGLNTLLKREAAAYDNLWSSLSTKQKQVLVALARAGKDEKLFSSSFLKKYNISSIGGMQKILKHLIEANILDKDGSQYSILDIIFKKWILKKS